MIISAALDTTELVGYAASVLVVVSLAMTSVVRLRTISLAGSIAFVAYGALIGSPPIVVTNAAIACLNVWFLRAELGGRRDLAVSVVPVDAPFLVDFIRYHRDDIHRFQPGFELPTGDGHVAMLLMRDGLPAGALVGRVEGANLHVLLDYVTKAYRDSRIASWLYGRGASVFRKLGVDRITTKPGTEAHSSYLARIGFRRVGDEYELSLNR